MTRGDGTAAGCEPGCQGCPWENTCDGPADICVKCGLEISYTGYIPDDAPLCRCPTPDRGTP